MILNSSMPLSSFNISIEGLSYLKTDFKIDFQKSYVKRYMKLA